MPAPTARRSPISLRRSATATSITFMIPIPATLSEIEAIATRTSVSTPRIDEKVSTTASWVITVTSSTRWRSCISSSTARLPSSRWSADSISRRMRNSDARLNMRIAVCTGITTTSSKLKPTNERPWGASTPTTR